MTAAVPCITIGQGLLPLLSNRDPFVLVEGPRGTGKSRGILSVLMCRALEYPGTRIMLARSTRTRLSQSILVTLEEQVFPAFGMDVPGGPGRENPSRYVLHNGSVFVPMGLDDQQRSQSAEYAWIYLAEGVEIPTLDDVTALAGTLRQAQAPFHQCIVDCNPWAPGHWLNQKAESVESKLRRVTDRAGYERLQEHNLRPAKDPQGRWKRLITRHQDNPAYFDVDRWEWTKRGRQYVDTTLKGLSGHLRRRWLDGDWVAAEGSVYPEFDEDRHVITPFKIPKTWPIFWGYDAGYDHPTAILWFTVAPNQALYVIDEIYVRQTGVDDLVKMVKEREKQAGYLPARRYADPQHVFSKTAQAPVPLSGQWARLGIRMGPWPRTGSNEETMVEAVRTRFKNESLKFFATCHHTIGDHQNWQYKRNAQGELPPGEDKFEDANNDCCDAVKGVIATNPKHTGFKVQVV